MPAQAARTGSVGASASSGGKGHEIDVPARTMSDLIDQLGIARVDLLLLDVEGGEIDMLGGLDFSRHSPDLVVAEDAYDEAVADFLRQKGYVRSMVLLERKFTRDCLYRKDEAIAMPFDGGKE